MSELSLIERLYEAGSRPALADNFFQIGTRHTYCRCVYATFREKTECVVPVPDPVIDQQAIARMDFCGREFRNRRIVSI